MKGSSGFVLGAITAVAAEVAVKKIWKVDLLEKTCDALDNAKSYIKEHTKKSSKEESSKEEDAEKK